MRGKFIVFEGIDGSGTSTQTALLLSALQKRNIKCASTCEPSDGPIGNLIRQIFKGRIKAPHGKNPDKPEGDLFDEQMAYLFAADRHDHLYNNIDGVHSLLEKGITVICTRYIFSSIAYHCASEKDFNFVHELNKNFPQPDLIIYLDNPIDESMKRMAHRKFKDTYENKEKLSQAKNNYSRAIENYAGSIIQVPATDPINAIHEKILNATLNTFGTITP
jgi:dTMP kinase